MKKEQDTFLRLNSLTKVYGEKTVVENMSLAVEKGEFVTLLGPSGCGKTTTIRMIAGFVSPTFGQITMSGKDITELQPQKRKMGMVFQDYALFPQMSVIDNVAYGLRVKKVSKYKRRKKALEMLDLVGLKEVANKYSHELSGGMKQRVALARALAINPEVLLLDEPFSALDAKNRETLRQEVLKLHEKIGITTILVTHDQSEAFELSNRVVLMNSGGVDQIGSPRDLYHQPKSEFASDFIGRSTKINASRIAAESENGIEKFRVATGSIIYAKSFEKLDSPNVILAIRPESVTLFKEENHAHSIQSNVWKGEVKSTFYYGATEEVQVYLPGLEITLALVLRSKQTGQKLENGTSVFVGVNAEDILVIPDKNWKKA